MAKLDLVGGRYVLFLNGERRANPLDVLPEDLVRPRNFSGYGAIAERVSAASRWAIQSRFYFSTTGGIGLDLDTFFIPKQFDELCDGTPREEVVRWLEKPTTLLVDAICEAKLDEIAMQEAEKLAQCDGEPYRLPPAFCISFGPIDQRIIEIGFGRRSPSEGELVFEAV